MQENDVRATARERALRARAAYYALIGTPPAEPVATFEEVVVTCDMLFAAMSTCYGFASQAHAMQLPAAYEQYYVAYADLFWQAASAQGC